jgi:hypothetical protein
MFLTTLVHLFSAFISTGAIKEVGDNSRTTVTSGAPMSVTRGDKNYIRDYPINRYKTRPILASNYSVQQPRISEYCLSCKLSKFSNKFR